MQSFVFPCIDSITLDGNEVSIARSIDLIRKEEKKMDNTVYLNRRIQEALVNKWGKVLDAGRPIENVQAKISTALVLENIQREHEMSQMIREAAPAGSLAAYSGGGFGSWDPNQFGPGDADARTPTIVIPLIRRIFPELIAHELVGVQPMPGPVSFVYALRFGYGIHGQFQTSGSHEVARETELGYNNLDTTFPGASGTSTVPSISAAYWQSYAGAANTSIYGGETHLDGQGASLTQAEWAKLGVNMPTAEFKFVRATVEAKERMLAGSYSQEFAEDMLRMQGLNADEEMANAISYGLKASIDRQCLSEIIRSAIVAGYVSTWSPISADGRNQIERIGALWTHILEKSNDIAAQNRMGAGNFVFASPKVCALLQRAQTSVGVKIESGKAIPAPAVGTGSVSRVGILGDTHALYRDTFAGGNYACIGYKGKTPMESGVIYCPYVPLQISRTVGYDDFNPRIRVRTRDGIIGENGRPASFPAGMFYSFVKIDDLTGVGLMGDSSNDRVFTFA